MRTLQIWPTKRAYIFIYICAADLHPNCGVRAVARFSASDSSEGTREPRGSKGSRCKGMVGGEIKTVRVGAGVEAGHGDGAGSTCGSGRSGRFNGQVSEGRRTGPKMSARCRTLRRGAHPYRASRERLSTEDPELIVRLNCLAVSYTAAPALCLRLQCATRSVSCNDSNVHVVVQNNTLQHATATAKEKTPGVKTNDNNAQS